MTVTIGAVFQNDKLTIAVRRERLIDGVRVDVLDDPIVPDAGNVGDAVAELLGLCARPEFREFTPDRVAIYIEAGTLADAICKEIRKYERAPFVESVDGFTASFSPRFANRHSELVHELRTQVEEGKLRIPPAYREQLAAFEPEEKDGRLLYPSAIKVASKLDRHPTLAAAAILAVIQGRAGGVGQTESDWNPHADDRE